VTIGSSFFAGNRITQKFVDPLELQSIDYRNVICQDDHDEMAFDSAAIAVSTAWSVTARASLMH